MVRFRVVTVIQLAIGSTYLAALMRLVSRGERWAWREAISKSVYAFLPAPRASLVMKLDPIAVTDDSQPLLIIRRDRRFLLRTGLPTDSEVRDVRWSSQGDSRIAARRSGWLQPVQVAADPWELTPRGRLFLQLLLNLQVLLGRARSRPKS